MENEETYEHRLFLIKNQIGFLRHQLENNYDFARWSPQSHRHYQESARLARIYWRRVEKQLPFGDPMRNAIWQLKWYLHQVLRRYKHRSYVAHHWLS
jgi:hypothetical protein